MPREGVFARVVHGGKISVGDELEIAVGKIPLDAAVITASDTRGEREDLSGAKAVEMLTAAGYKIAEKIVLPDDKAQLAEKMIELADFGVGLIVTTGGTGFSPSGRRYPQAFADCESAWQRQSRRGMSGFCFA